MIIVYGVILIAFVLLLFPAYRSRERFSSSGRNPFTVIAAYIYGRLRRKRIFEGKQTERELEMLFPGKAGKEKKYLHKYYTDKISKILMVVFIGNVFAIFLYLSQLGESVLVDGRIIYRNTYGLGEIETSLQAEIEEEGIKTKQDFSIVVEEQRYEQETVAKLAKEAAEQLPELILDENVSREEVRANLNLVKKIEGYPFEILWESDNYQLIYTDGVIANESIRESGEIVNLTAALVYEDFREEHIFAVRILPPEHTREESIHRQIKEVIDRREDEGKEEEQLILPEMVEGAQIEWKEKGEDSSGYFFLLICIGALAIYLMQDKEIHAKAELRNRQMLLDYPGIVSRLTLYMGAGMTVRGAFAKIAYDYRDERKKCRHQKYRFIYEEMLITCYELDSGISEAAAYESFSRRCRLPQYTRLGNLLSQNLRKGSSGIMELLRQEAVNAFEERRNLAKKLGEEAGTKLLFPMMLMLGVVMVLIMIPAYFSFSI